MASRRTPLAQYPHLIEFPFDEIKNGTLDFTRRLGGGTNGTVYRCTMSHGDVAVKAVATPTSAHVRHFELEVAFASKYRHPAIAVLQGVCFSPNGTERFLIFELLEGGDASSGIHFWQYWQRLGGLTSVAEGLAFLQGVQPKGMHGDLKSANIALVGDAHAKILDFGFGRECFGDAVQMETPFGTIGYQSPEAEGTLLLSERSEVFSFGMVLLEWMTGLPVSFQDRSGIRKPIAEVIQPGTPGDLSRLMKNIDGRAQFPTRLAEKLGQLALRCLSEKRLTFATILGTLKNLCEEYPGPPPRAVLADLLKTEEAKTVQLQNQVSSQKQVAMILQSRHSEQVKRLEEQIAVKDTIDRAQQAKLAKMEELLSLQEKALQQYRAQEVQLLVQRDQEKAASERLMALEQRSTEKLMKLQSELKSVEADNFRLASKLSDNLVSSEQQRKELEATLAALAKVSEQLSLSEALLGQCREDGCKVSAALMSTIEKLSTTETSLATSEAKVQELVFYSKQLEEELRSLRVAASEYPNSRMQEAASSGCPSQSDRSTGAGLEVQTGTLGRDEEEIPEWLRFDVELLTEWSDCETEIVETLDEEPDEEPA